MSNNDNQNKKSSSLPEGIISSVKDDEAITEINLTDFLEESTKSAPLFEGFHEDIKNAEESLETDLQSLYDDIMGSAPETIVPKPLSVLTGNSEPTFPVAQEASGLENLWMNPDEYFGDDIPVVALDEPEVNEYTPSAPVKEEAVFAPEKAVEPTNKTVPDMAMNDIFGMIDMLKTDSENEGGFGDILSEIESNENIAAVETELSVASQLVTDPEAFNKYGNEFDDALVEIEEEPAAPEIGADEKTISVPESPVNTDDEDFEKELAFLLGDEVPEEKPAEEDRSGFFITVPDDGNDYESAAVQPEKLYEAAPMSESGISYMTQEEFEAKEAEKKKKSKKDKKNKKKEKTPEEKKANKKGDIMRTVVLVISALTILACSAILVNTYVIEPMKFQKTAQEVADQMVQNMNEHDQDAVVDSFLKKEFPDVDFPEGMLAKYAQLYAANKDLRGWISIPGFDINLPIAQGTDNDYYLEKDIYGKYTMYGVPFFDYRMTDFRNMHRNTVVYGHNMRSDDYIFGMLENYRTIDGFEMAPVIECNTIYGDYTWFVYAVFITNSRAQEDNGYLFPYNFIDVSPEKFESYIEEIDKRKLYTTGVDINANDKILTLSTCCYDFNEARLVVVARLKRDGESVNVDVSKAIENPNPKYPQAWYNAFKKPVNPYAEDTRW